MRQHLVQVKTRLRLLARHLNVYFLVLNAKQFDLGYIRHAQQLLPHVIGHGLDFSVAETIRLQRVNDAIHVTEIIVEKGTLHARR